MTAAICSGKACIATILDKKEFSTHGMGMQISYSVGTKKAKKGCVWEASSRDRDIVEKVV